MKKWISKGKGIHKFYYSTAVITFDIEVSSFYDGGEKRSVVYSWAICENGVFWMCRKRDDFKEKIGELVNKYLTRERHRLIIWVHNLSYEYQFIKRLFEWDEVFAINNEHKILYARTKEGLEFRCSYMLTQLSLYDLTKGCKFEKLKGELDYNLIRTPETPLEKKEIEYIKYDVLGLWQFMVDEIKKAGSIVDLPYTKTGYVRNYCREHMEGEIPMISQLTLTQPEYAKLNHAFTGGYVHCNAKYCDEILKNVTSLDFTSSYPSRILEYKYPMGKGRHVNINNFYELKQYLNCYCVLLTVKLTNVVCKLPCTFISKSKVLRYGEIYAEDNGRVFSADWLIMTLTDVDFEIIQNIYTVDKVEFLDSIVYKKDYLPKSFLQCVVTFYKEKTTMKGVSGLEKEYNVKKGMLNSLYGMCVTNPLHPSFQLANGDLYKEEMTQADEKTAIDKENYNDNRFLFYAWGVWISAYSRKCLMDVVMQLGDDWVYSDSDSIKLLNYSKHIGLIQKYDATIIKRLKETCFHYGFNFKDLNPVDILGVEHQLGTFTNEGTYSKFKTLGAKRYLYEENNKLHLTNSGIDKIKGAQYIKGFDENGVQIRIGADKVDAFQFYTNKMVVPAKYSGHTVSKYIDERKQGTITDYLGNTYEYNEPTGLHIELSDYHMELSNIYELFRVNF